MYNLVTLIFFGAIGAVGGYVLRRLEKFEENRDNFRALALTQIYTSASLFLEVVQKFVDNKIQKEKLVSILQSIESTLKAQIFDQGNVALLEDDKRKRITELYFAILFISKESETLDEDDLKTKFDENQTIGGTTLGTIKDMISKVQSDMNNELKYYRWKLPVIMILFVILLSVVSVIVTYINGVLAPK